MSAIAYFVSPHGFGHAARAAAVMAALRAARPDLELHVFTTVPRWFFDDSVPGPLAYHPVRADVGFEQSHPMVEDLAATVETLAAFWSALPAKADELARVVERHAVELVVSDISSLGLEVAARAGRPGVLVENFTWDWIYRPYLEAEPRLAEYARANAGSVAKAALRIQTEPVCAPVPSAERVAPVSREPRAGRAAVRRAVGLGEEDERPLVLMTMGGMGWRSEVAAGLAEEAFVVTLGGTDSLRRDEGRLALPDRSPIYPPDLAAAADLVVAKLGYSTVAECARGGARMLFLERPRFPESAVLADFCRRRLGGAALAPDALESGEWLAELRAMLARPAPSAGGANGAEQIADLLARRLPSS